MKNILHNLLPRWYGISWLKEEKAIVLNVYPSMRPLLECIRRDSPVVPHLQKEFKFARFTEGLNGRTFGFDDCLELSSKKDALTFKALLPKVRVQTEKNCRNCKGSKRDEMLDDECLSCRGTGKEWKYDWQKPFALSVTLGLILMQLEFPEEFPENPDRRQFLTVRLYTAKGTHGGELSGIYSIPVMRWLAIKTQGTQIPEMTEAMKTAHTQMLGEPFFTDKFRASIDSSGGWLNVECSDCSLHPSSPFRQDRGCEFSSHNSDSPAQQLALLAGLAALHDRVDKELY